MKYNFKLSNSPKLLPNYINNCTITKLPNSISIWPIHFITLFNIIQTAK